MKKTFIIASILSIVLIIISSFTAIFIFNKKDKIKINSSKLNIIFELNDKEYTNVEINSNYEEKGANLKIGNKDVKDEIIVDSTNLDTTKKGKYYVIYKYKMNDYRILTKYRLINVVDTKPPVITLKGKEIERIELGKKYTDQGYDISDNSKEDLKDKVKVTGSVDTSRVGTYEIKYEAKDSSNNKIDKIRKVIVYKKINIVKVASVKNDKGEEKKDFNYNNYNNTATKMSFNNTGFYLEGFYKNYNGNFKIKISGNGIDKIYDMASNGTNKYKGNIDITSLQNGTYNMYVVTDKVDNLINALPIQNRIVRAKVKDKLVTMNYVNNQVQFKIENFTYQYDIFIDPGHGGRDPGAINSVMKESELNLIQSLYEKQRYKQHGLKVLMVRTNDSDGMVMGPSDWQTVRRRAYAMGYYGVVSKIMYSNHHNSFGNTVRSGWEIILPATLNRQQLSTEYDIASEWSKIYPLLDNHIRLYARHYDNNSIYSKPNGEVYNFTNYYAVMRLPYDLYNVKSILYEGCYMSNSSDFSWYYTEGNWKKLSEIKIKHYVESLGLVYIPVG